MIWFLGVAGILIWGLVTVLAGPHTGLAGGSLFGWIAFNYVFPILFGGFFVGVIFGGIAWAIAAVVGAALPQKQIASTEELVAIRGKDGVSGQFFLGSGTLKGEQYYFYYSKSEDGSLHPGRLSADSSVTIREIDGEGAALTRCGWDFAWGGSYLFGVPSMESRYEFRVPKGTVRTGYTM